ncbi:hypothetical protein DWB77_00009 [Streptomyces hundungensis]|uniref:Uncharacterized protein n=1 Tax=Streptomyces hundungensis TaxID=1077946 RepID=A0A387HB09_9ACTN|nr:hypothetical protein [Streptomyces hundungensis]AYG77902.1 hypothetical protein DWB77_00009 [Streptomyces hundungensis]
MDVFALFSICIPVALGLCALAGALTGRLSARHFYALLTTAMLIRSIANIAQGKALYAATDAALTAYYAWRWWKNGGGDDTKRRLRSVAKGFTPTRRTAPTTA